jgi:chromosome segregation ATPase
MQQRIFEICNKLAGQGIKPTLERVRNELGSGSFSTINPILKQWKETRETSDSSSAIDLPTDITAIGLKATALIWKAANDHCADLVKAVRHEAEQLVEQEQTERDEALTEIKRLESENERLADKLTQQSELLDELKIKAALSEKADETINALRVELEKAQKETAKLEGMLTVYEFIGKQPEPETVTKPQATRKTKQQPV